MGWLLALVLAVLLYRARRELGALRQLVETAETERVWGEAQRESGSGAADDQPLVSLRLQLRRMRDAGKLEEANYLRLTSAIDARWESERARAHGTTPNASWWASCQSGWNILTANGLIPHGLPPWRRTAAPAVEGEATDAAVKASPPQAPPTTAKKCSKPEFAPDTYRSTALAEERKVQEHCAEPPQRRPQRAPAAARSASASPAARHAWKPVEPGRLERALQAVSGWPRSLVPFLVQNIGWFIGTFLFLAGTVFLVTYTSGYLKAAVVFSSLFAYAGFLTWSGYKLSLKQPRLATAASVLLFTGLLLVPLSISAATRLLMNASGSVLLWTVSVAASALCVAAAYAGAQFVSGVVHRALRTEFPRVFVALAAIQLSAPLVAQWPHWLTLGLVHLAILALLAFGLVRLAQQWLRSVYVDRKRTVFFAAGALLFAAATSFVHLTWGVRAVSLPVGYYAPYLMLLSALLLYLDAKLKAQTHRHVFLSRLTFAIYGLSLVAVLLAFNAPAARLVTLVLAAVVYAMVVWHYLTLIPLYLMLASLATLYALTVLTHFPAVTHLLLALPGLGALYALSRWAGRRGRERPPTQAHGLWKVAMVTYRGTLLLVILLAGWSIAQGGPSPLAGLSAVVLGAGLWWLLRLAPGPVWPRRCGANEALETVCEPVNLLRGAWLYAPVAAGSLAFVLMPPIGGLDWALQASPALGLTGVLWSALMIWGRRCGATRLPIQAEVCANAALLSVAAGALLALWPALDAGIHGSTILTLGAGTAVMLAISLDLHVRWLFYVFMLLGGATAAAVKLSYFPGHSVGLSEFLAAAALWILVWWLDRQPEEYSELARNRALNGAPKRLLWLLPAVSQLAGKTVARGRPGDYEAPVAGPHQGVKASGDGRLVTDQSGA